MKLLIAGANWLPIEAIKLYEQRAVTEIAGIKSGALRKLGPSGAAFGVAGTPSWTLAGEAVALSLVTGFLASAAAKEGAKELRKAQELTERLLLSSGEYFSPNEIAKIVIPSPAIWSAKRDNNDFCHSGEDFIYVRLENGQELSIKWASVSCCVAD